MLILTIGRGKKIIIDEKITVTILKVKPHQICFAIEAPSFISVSKEEAEKTIKHKNDILEKTTSTI